VPIYEYECNSCHYRFEEKQGFHDEPVAICPKCQGPVRRVLHAAPVIFKGSGFYVTDNRKGSDIESEWPKEKVPDKLPSREESKED
jgi:putative FmdB family regulatory protein